MDAIESQDECGFVHELGCIRCRDRDDAANARHDGYGPVGLFYPGILEIPAIAATPEIQTARATQDNPREDA